MARARRNLAAEIIGSVLNAAAAGEEVYVRLHTGDPGPQWPPEDPGSTVTSWRASPAEIARPPGEARFLARAADPLPPPAPGSIRAAEELAAASRAFRGHLDVLAAAHINAMRDDLAFEAVDELGVPVVDSSDDAVSAIRYALATVANLPAGEVTAGWPGEATAEAIGALWNSQPPCPDWHMLTYYGQLCARCGHWITAIRESAPGQLAVIASGTVRADGCVIHHDARAREDFHARNLVTGPAITGTPRDASWPPGDDGRPYMAVTQGLMLLDEPQGLMQIIETPMQLQDIAELHHRYPAADPVQTSAAYARALYERTARERDQQGWVREPDGQLTFQIGASTTPAVMRDAVDWLLSWNGDPQNWHVVGGTTEQRLFLATMLTPHAETVHAADCPYGAPGERVAVGRETVTCEVCAAAAAWASMPGRAPGSPDPTYRALGLDTPIGTDMSDALDRAADADELGEAYAAMNRRLAVLDTLPGDVRLTVAGGPGREYEAWVHAAAGVWYAPAGEDTEDLTAETMTAAELRDLLASR